MVNLVVEDGTGLPDSNSYISIAEAKEYATNRGIDLGTDDTIAANLILAADYMETTGPYKGVMVNSMQALSFPRTEITYRGEDFEGVPPSVKKAQAQLLLDIKDSGALLTSNRQYALKRRKLEGLEQEWAVGSYAAYKPAASHKIYDTLMSEYTYGGGSNQTYCYR